MYKGSPSHITGFAGDIWPCISTPAHIFTGQVSAARYVYDAQDGQFILIDNDKFYDRYQKLTLSYSAASIYYTSDTDVDYNTGFVAVKTAWTDTEAHRDTEFYLFGDLIFSTSNRETTDGVLNGTRGNILGAFIHPESGWGTLVYQVNTFYDWMPQVSGSVLFDYYIYCSGGIHTKLASAAADITGVSSQGSGFVASMPVFYSAVDKTSGNMQFGSVVISEAGTFSSDGSTNIIGASQYHNFTFFSRDEASESSFSIPVSDGGYISTEMGDPVHSTYDIYMKKR
jgi:hypothetical protein